MSEHEDAVAAMFADVTAFLARRWPEHKVAPDLTREAELMELLGSPQRSAPVIHVAGTNGKTSTARMIESLLRAFGLHTGLYTSPHLSTVRERICLDGEPVDEQRFVDAFAEVVDYVGLVDAAHPEQPMTAFEVLTGLAFACFADAPVDVMIVEAGMGGSWDATNVVDPTVAVFTTLDLDHREYLGETIEEIASEKAGIIKSGTTVVIGRQEEDALRVLKTVAAQSGARVVEFGPDFTVENRVLAVGGQVISLSGVAGDYPDNFLPLHGQHMADNAATALAAVECFFSGDRRLNLESVQAGFGEVRSPGRLEILRTGPTVVVDAAHNPAGVRALAAALGEAFDFDRVVGVFAAMADKDVSGMLDSLGEAVDELVVTTNSSPRAMPVDDLSALALSNVGGDHLHVADDLADALEVAMDLSDQWLAQGVSSCGIVVTGSVVTVGEVRTLLEADQGRRV